jgi:hypothetical protein
VNDSLDLLAEFMGCGDSVAAVTNKVHNQHRFRIKVASILTQLTTDRQHNYGIAYPSRAPRSQHHKMKSCMGLFTHISWAPTLQQHILAASTYRGSVRHTPMLPNMHAS